ncbi:hypothetical protein DBV15_03476 [Temnothorax longispinosus]|uniref:Uncharacterized protein n=1 Tax=Temnothorax longispinosus TaxID=300112 RepID=A0A4S2KE38_9HYME|nr:hypothetical protein DBV15_03476 [Temnothorax longispinosus]
MVTGASRRRKCGTARTRTRSLHKFPTSLETVNYPVPEPVRIYWCRATRRLVIDARTHVHVGTRVGTERAVPLNRASGVGDFSDGSKMAHVAN